MSQAKSARIAGPLLPVLLVVLLGGLGIGACSRRRPPAPPRPVPAKAAVAYDVRMGQTTYHHYCETCHGESGAGDGFNAFNLDPRPRDLSDPAFQRAKKDEELTDAIRRGGAGVGLSALMPPWGHTLSERQIADVVVYLRTLKR